MTTNTNTTAHRSPEEIVRGIRDACDAAGVDLRHAKSSEDVRAAIEVAAPELLEEVLPGDGNFDPVIARWLEDRGGELVWTASMMSEDLEFRSEVEVDGTTRTLHSNVDLERWLRGTGDDKPER